MATKIYRLTIQSSDASGNRFQNVFHYQADNEDPTNEVADMASIASDLANAIDDMLPQTVTIDTWFAHKLDALGRWQPVGKGTIGQAGQVAGDVLPYQAAAVSLGYTNTAKTIAKKWIGPLSETHQNAGNASAALIALLEAFCTIWTSVNQGVVAAYTPGSWSAGKGFHAIVSGVCNSILGTQRRRKPGVGM